jgi:hypothetical protein
MEAAFCGDPGLPNLRRTTIESPQHEGMRARGLWVRYAPRGLPDLGGVAMLNAAKGRRWPEGPLPEINNSEELEAWLRKQPREVSVVFAARAALRVLPVVQLEKRETYIRDLVLPVFRATAISWAAAKYPAREKELATACRAAAAALVAQRSYLFSNGCDPSFRRSALLKRQPSLNGMAACEREWVLNSRTALKAASLASRRSLTAKPIRRSI